ncbi:pep a2 [Streptomyces sp. ME02-8801-2C]|uniref:pep a2 n=1 Tax=Streptomyces sp. ME02-8801-2C TaxID=3028680 RepID=UPI0029B3A93A|nr:pep a2 [Streptomyces sp. ME02-8801-2C]MDX3456510.1 pep a2 [Streptomyces sp. ME02-8801-2C]
MKTAEPCYYHLDVEVCPERVGQVGRILAAHLRLWDLEHLVGPVCHGAEALLRAIDEHASDKNAVVEMWWNGQHIITAIGENDTGPHLDQELGSCLARIAAESDGWGCCATDTGAKVIWFSRRARSCEGVPLIPSPPPPTLPERRRAPRPLPAFAGTESRGSDVLTNA